MTIVTYPDFSFLVEKIKPSVVAITTESITYDALSEQTQTEMGQGSGWIIDERGTIVTNNHVVEGAKTVTVQLYDRKAYKAEFIRTDPATDVAVLKINPDRKLQPLPINDTSNLKVGDWVMVMGNPLGMGISVKEGIISRLGVAMSSSPEQIYSNLIETSAAINRGNSGGPMVNMNGEVVGMTSLKIDASGIEGMGYAITIGDIMPIIQVLSNDGKIVRPWLGANLVTLDSALAILYDLDIGSGALVTRVSIGSPADEAGISVGNIITGCNGKPIASAEELLGIIKLCKVGQDLKLVVWQGKNQKAVMVTLIETPSLIR